MVLTLSVLMTIVGIAIPSYKVFETSREEQQFFDLLLHDIYFSQSECYRTNKTIGILFHQETHSYNIVSDMLNTVAVRKMPESIVLKKTSNIVDIVYWTNCSIADSGILKFGTSTGEKTIVVHLGKGRVIFSE